MNRLVLVFWWLPCLSPGGETWAQKSFPTVRIGIEAPAGTNSHYFVTKQMGLFQKHGINIELISFPGGTVGLQALFAGDIQFATSDGVAGLSANLRGANLYFVAGMINTFPVQHPVEAGDPHAAGSARQEDRDQPLRLVVGYGSARGGGEIRSQTGQGRDHFAGRRPNRAFCRSCGPARSMPRSSVRRSIWPGKKMGFNEVIDLSESGVAYSHQQIVAIKDYLDRNPDTVLRTLRALCEGLAAWKDPAKKSVVLTHVSKYLRLDPEKQKDQLEETYRYYSKTFPTKPYATAEGLELTAQILKKSRPEAKDIQAKDWLNNRFIAELEKEGFLAKVFGGK